MSYYKKSAPKKTPAPKKEAPELTSTMRKDIARFMAFSGQNTYLNVSEFCVSAGGFKKYAEETTKYYIKKAWMKGSPLKGSGYFNYNQCDVLPFYQLAIIAHTSMDDAESILNMADDVHNENRYWSNYDNSLGKFTKIVNIYCRAFPETLATFQDVEDFSTDTPTEEETKLAKSRWELAINDLLTFTFSGSMIRTIACVFQKPVFKEFVQSLPKDVFINIFDHTALRYWNMEFLSIEEYNYMLELATAPKNSLPSHPFNSMQDYLIFYNHFLLHGDIESHLQKMHPGSSPNTILTAIKFLQEEHPDDAIKVLESFLKTFKMQIFGEPVADFIYGLALLLSTSASSIKKATTLQKRKAIRENQAIPYFRLLLQMKANPETDFGAWIPNNLNCGSTTQIGAALFSMLCMHYGYCTTLYKDTAMKYTDICIKKGVNVMALNMAADLDVYKTKAEELQELTKMKPLLPKVKKLEKWEIVINAMMQKFDTGNSSSSKKTAVKEEISRVSYLLDTTTYNVQPRLQKSKNGGTTWSSGRNIALKNFQAGIPEMTAQDARVALQVESYSYGWYGGTSLELSGAKAIEALIGHPYVYDESNPDLKIEIQAEKLQIEVKETAGGFKVSKNVASSNGVYDTISVYQENAQLIKVIRISKEEDEILTLLDRIGTFPKASKEKLTQLLAVLGKKITVMSPLLKDAGNIKQKKGDSKLTVQLVPYDDQFTVRSFVKPLVSCPPYCTPGKGLEYIAANVKGEMVQVARNLTAEKKNLKAFTEWMEPFDDYAEDEYWQLPIESCLEVLDTLRQHQDSCNIEWPEGVRFSVKKPALSADSISLSVKGIGHWFEVDGEVQIDDKQKMKVSELLKRVREAKGRFIQIGDAEYMALSQQLQKQLSALDRIMQTDHRQLKIASFNSSFLQDMANAGVTVKADKKYTEMLKRMDEADSMKISVPKTLQADLRDYQKEGYRWLCRLAHWGAGACLADDMGLGKTIQTIALLLARAKEGASLVVMPTSVLINWKNELQRFAPSLNPIILRSESDRADAIEKAGSQDVVLITYGLLPTEEETLTKKKWNVIVLDEAHTIKNKETKTSKVAMQLEGQFRLLLTGTPLQNHLSEIWNLFQFATPGLLTGYTQFTQEFINPIEKEHNKEPQRLLKRMLQPFILRRTKSEVLNELPEKTEITLKVELSEAERALYDRFREEAVLNLEEGSTTAIKALAELTRLRQTACNAALVLPAKEAKDIPSSKMEAFLKLVDELMRNHHRALVFSQFTSHLALVQKALKKLKIDYEYLDGGVTPTERLKRVSEFQKGDMPLFLISLKAGGTGLNLTAADYVIHLDPWWNPAIEDQASDRAYRIGQDKPVTVYRLIAENTIEEKIIALHQTKKSLADALLEGSDMAYALGKDEILNLIRGNQ